MSMSLTRRLQVLIDDERYSALEREAGRTGRSVGAVVREALDDRLGSVRPDAREAGARLLAAPPASVGEPDDLALELAALAERFPPA
jgi:Ribbon-helix-helix protein, copG family